MLVLHKDITRRYPRFFGVHASAEVMMNHSLIPFYAACMVIQLVPSDTIVAHFPTTAERIAVPGVELLIGATLLDADTSNWACKFLNATCRPT